MSKHLQVVPGLKDQAAGQVASIQNVASEIPSTVARLSPKEKKLWDHVTQSLHECGLIHRTDAMLLTVICKTFVRWVEAEEHLSKLMKENDGAYFVKTPNGYEQPHQIFYVARNLKRDLLQWLPEAALTIPSFQKAIAVTSTAGAQGQLPGMEDPVELHRKRKTAAGMRVLE